MLDILVPVDFSKEARYALNFALDIARSNEVKILAFHVVDYPTGATIDPVGMAVPTPYDPDFIELLKKNAGKQMDYFLADFEGDIESEISVGNPYLDISDKISELDVDLVVMGTKGSSGLKEFFIGSNAEKIVRTAKCPVITLSQATTVEEITDIVFATNLIDVSEEIMTQVKRLQGLFNSKLHLVRINTPNSFERDHITQNGLQEMAKRYLLSNYTINIYNDIYQDQGILSFAAEIDANLIAMGTHGRKGLKHLLSGSLAEDVVNHAHRPIWTYHISND
ncbi:MAG: universal stress protein [Bacteroidota bacterium]